MKEDQGTKLGSPKPKRRMVLVATLAVLAAALPGIGVARQQQGGQAVQSTEAPPKGGQRRSPASLIGHKDEHTASRGPQKSVDRVHLRSRLVNSTLTVADRSGGYITGLTRNNFKVFDNGVIQDIAYFSDDDAPISLGIIYDVSGSMRDLTNVSFQALKSFFDSSHEDDQYFIFVFNDHPMLVQDFTISPAEIMQRVISVKATGSTALYDAVYLGVEKARQGRHTKKALLLISDGLDNNSQYNQAELRELLQEANVPIYCIGRRELDIGSVNLKNISEWSGGHAFFPGDGPRTFDIYSNIANMLRHQYVIGFYPSDTAGKAPWHKVLINVKAPPGLGRLSLYYKNGYSSFK
jgi:Ca-activated chloride channel family protein